ncbi:DUF4142 domain-containing protein [Corallococcus sp. H22C18031201]|uniref:DUF4142 domain-containing protein n=1 Tax=Citreicoccus inhibens TaxID=2849499 RepID=UPI000E70CC75|nr:DUF4142 domain-containing protein [Citreicoccus inhibens]MBU8895891.1 DUF4142 domain-containing protein [Citreicoccus inhibens]RJS23894.1 DUF4142 domain-containing protein [Corallococcus sp. H22C18031201]
MRKNTWGKRAVLATMMTGAFGFGVVAHADDKMAKQDKQVGEAAAKRTKYVGRLALFNSKQIALAQLAEQQATDPQVKAFASQLLQDHQSNQADLKAWAQSKQIEVDTVDLSGNQEGVGGSGMQQGYNDKMKNVGEKLGKQIDEDRKEINELKAKQGKEFDKAFLSRIADDQKDGRELLNDGRREYKNDATFLALLNKTETVVDSHESTAKQLEKQMKSSKMP